MYRIILFDVEEYVGSILWWNCYELFRNFLLRFPLVLLIYEVGYWLHKLIKSKKNKYGKSKPVVIRTARRTQDSFDYCLEFNNIRSYVLILCMLIEWKCTDFKIMHDFCWCAYRRWWRGEKFVEGIRVFHSDLLYLWVLLELCLAYFWSSPYLNPLQTDFVGTFAPTTYHFHCNVKLHILLNALFYFLLASFFCSYVSLLTSNVIN